MWHGCFLLFFDAAKKGFKECSFFPALGVDVASFVLAYLAALGVLRFCSCSCSCSCLLRVERLCFRAFLFSSRLPGGGITFFAAAKKVIKESSFSTTHTACPV
jgi:hypothetical protein